ncbi:MAG: DNA polymerase III subunit alpha [Chloroflexota bacterium]
MSIAPNDFTHLHVHTEFSLLDGLGRIDDLVGQASAQGFDSLAITDHGALYGAVAFYQACTAREIKPIIGVETYVARRTMRDRDPKADAQPFHLVLLAQDWTGYRNLCRLVTEAHVEGYYYKPRVDKELLARHSEGLIGLSACLGGEIPRALETDDVDAARRIAGEYADIFGKDRFFLEVQDHGIPEQAALTPKLLRLAPQVGLPLVATNDLHYVRRDQHEAHDVLLCVGTASNLSDPNRFRIEGEEHYLKSAAEMAALFGEIPGAIANTRRIAEMTNLVLPFGKHRLPRFPVPDGHTVETWLRAECERGLIARFGSITDTVRARLDYELGVIITMGYAAYFLIVADFVRFAREQRIATTCRGSAPGSIVTYSLGITPVDPIAYQLPFERFLNPDRVTMPDIDVDFEDARRDEVIHYVTRKYGQDHVAQIITFGTMLARAAIRDVGRVLGLGYSEVDRIAKAVPEQLGITLDEALATSSALREMTETDPQIDRLIGIAKQLEGVARNASTHAAGVVISDEPLTELMPLQKATNSDALMTQYEMHGVEALGLLKFDFLGLSNLTILRQAVDLIAEIRGTERIDLDRIPLDDAKTFELLGSGETTGVFQLESAGMRRYIKELRPSSVYDLAAMVALFRPGPMDNIPAYIRRKHGQEAVTYLHPLLKPYLEKTYGIFVYQEDIMAAAVALGGFTGPEADTLGYAIRKKKAAVLRAQKEKFITQAAERGVPAETIDAVFKAFEPFERYGFNKAHATCYGMIAYQTAYLKANYTVEYMCSVLTAFRDNTAKVAAAVAECRRLGITVEPPDIHQSGLHFTVEGRAIRFGLLAIKNVGESAIESIVAARADGGPFRSLADLCARVDLRLVNKRVLESLIKVGALAALGHPAQLLLALDDAIGFGQAQQRDRVSGQVSLFDSLGTDDTAALARPLPSATPVTSRERLRWEKELLGLYLSDHPLGELAGEIGRYVNAYSGELGADLDTQRVAIGGVVTALRRVVTKSRAEMGVATLEDLQGPLEVVVFPRTWEETGPTWAEDAVLLVAGRVDHKGDETVVLADAVWTWDDAVALGPEGFARAVAAGDRPRRGGGRDRGALGGDRGGGWGGDRATGNGNGHGNGNGNGNGTGNGGARPAVPAAVAEAPRPAPAPPAAPTPGPVPAAPAPFVRTIPRVSPLRGSAVTGSLEVTITGTRHVTRPLGAVDAPPIAPPPAPPADGAASAAPPPATATDATPLVHAPAAALPPAPGTTGPEPGSLAPIADGPSADEPPWPEEERVDIARAAGAPTDPLEAAEGRTVHVRFAEAGPDAVIAAFGALRDLFAARPGATPVVLHVPAPGGPRPMALRHGVAWDAELLAEAHRRLGALVALDLA